MAPHRGAYRPAASSTWRTGSSSCAPAASRRRNSVCTVAAGDLVGAWPLVSAAFQTSPAVEEMNALGLDITSVGNHEFDEGVDELLRLQNGGCHPTDGCQDGDGFAGASYPMLAANVVKEEQRQADPPGVQGQEGRRHRRRLRRHDPRGHAEHREPSRHHLGRLPRRGGDRQQVRPPARGQGRGRAGAAPPRGRPAVRPPPTRVVAPASAAPSRTSWPASTRRTGSWSAATPTSPTSATCPTAPASRRSCTSAASTGRPGPPTSPSPSTRPRASSPWRPRSTSSSRTASPTATVAGSRTPRATSSATRTGSTRWPS